MIDYLNKYTMKFPAASGWGILKKKSQIFEIDKVRTKRKPNLLLSLE